MNVPQDTLLIRADAGPAIGTGHIMRSIALGQSWQRLGGQLVFVCGVIPKGLENRIRCEGFQVYCVNGKRDQADARDTREIAIATEANWVALDGYRFDDGYQALVKNPSHRLAVMDDFGHARHSHADLVLNPNVYACPELYKSSNSSTEFLLGPRYLLLRKEFAEQVHLRIRKPMVALAKKILVTFGGADPDNVTLRAVEALANLKRRNLVIDVVVGAHYRHLNELNIFKRKSGLNIRVHRNVDRMSALINRVDVAISAGGSTCYELAQCGVPCLALSIAENQRNVAKRLDELGVVVYAGHTDEVSTRDLSEQISRVLSNTEQRREMSLRGRQLVDGHGADRVARCMGAKGFQLLEATMDDAERLLSWRNDPATRSASFSSETVSAAGHRQWLRDRIQSDSCWLWIALNRTGLPVGQIRFDLADKESATISIALDESTRGHGIGTLLIEKACRRFIEQSGVQKIIAQVKPENRASQNAFLKAGFHAQPPTMIDDQTAFQFVYRSDNQELGFLARSYNSLRESA